MPVISVSLQLLKRTERRREGFLGPWDFKSIKQISFQLGFFVHHTGMPQVWNWILRSASSVCAWMGRLNPPFFPLKFNKPNKLLRYSRIARKAMENKYSIPVIWNTTWRRCETCPWLWRGPKCTVPAHHSLAQSQAIEASIAKRTGAKSAKSTCFWKRHDPEWASIDQLADSKKHIK